MQENDNKKREEDLADRQKIEMFLISNREYFPSTKLFYLKSRLEKANDRKLEMLSTINLKSPQIISIVSLVLGIFGVDRFMIGDIGIGILKLLTLGLCGILWFYDLFTIKERVKKINFENVMILL